MFTLKNITPTASGSVTLTANWETTPFTVTANANEGTIPATTGWTVASGSATATKSVKYLDSYGSLPTPTRTGYEFVGWTKNYINLEDLANDFLRRGNSAYGSYQDGVLTSNSINFFALSAAVNSYVNNQDVWGKDYTYVVYHLPIENGTYTISATTTGILQMVLHNSTGAEYGRLHSTSSSVTFTVSDGTISFRFGTSYPTGTISNLTLVKQGEVYASNVPITSDSEQKYSI